MLKRSVAAYIESFQDLSRDIWVLSVVTFINRSGTMVIPFLSVYLKTVLGFSLIQVSWVMAVFGCGSLLGSYLGGRLTDVLGHYKVQFWSLFLAGWLYMSLIWVKEFEHWLLAVFLLSVIADSFRPATMAAMADYSTEGNRTRSLSLLRLAINLGWMAGPAFGGLIAGTIGYSALFLVDGCTCLAASVVFLTFLKNKTGSEQDAGESSEEEKAEDAFYNKPYLVFLLFHLVVLVCFMQLFLSLPVYFKEHFLLNELWIGLLMALNGLIIVLFEMPLIFQLEEKARKLQWVAFGAALIGLTYVLFLLAPGWVWICLPAMLALSFGEIFYMPFSNTFALAQSKPGNRGSYMGWYAMAGSGAFILAPLVGFQVVEYVGYPALWGMLSVFCAGAVGAFLLFDREGVSRSARETAGSS